MRLNALYNLPIKNVRQDQEDGRWTSTLKILKKQQITNKNCIDKKQQKYLLNTAYLSNQI